LPILRASGTRAQARLPGAGHVQWAHLLRLLGRRAARAGARPERTPL